MSLNFSNWRVYLAEFLGTFVFVFISLGAAIVNSLYGEIGLVGVAVASGFAYASAVYATVGVSGGYLNPAITVSMWLVERLGFFEAIFYITFQILAGFVATVGLFLIFGAEAIANLPSNLIETGSFSTSIVIEPIMTAILIFVFMATMVDKRGLAAFGPLAVGLVVVFATIFGSFAGANFNPAKMVGVSILTRDWIQLGVGVIGPLTGSLFSLIYSFAFLRKGKKD